MRFKSGKGSPDCGCGLVEPAQAKEKKTQITEPHQGRYVNDVLVEDYLARQFNYFCSDGLRMFLQCHGLPLRDYIQTNK